jgi:hypothetical protein
VGPEGIVLDDGRRQDRQSGPSGRLGDALPGRPLPLGAGLAIVHHEVVVGEFPGDAEGESPAVDRRSWTTALPQSGHQVTATGRLAMSSTISWWRYRSG